MMGQHKFSTVLFCLLAVYVQLSHQVCNSTNCVGPACRCMSTTTPGGLTLANTPQLVFLSFDGAITTSNIVNYTSVLSNRLNPNGCPISATFFVNHEYNDYALTHDLFYKGHEIATHTVSHSLPSSDWSSKTPKQWIDEISGQRTILSRFANIPITGIRGSKAPFLQTSGDATMQAMTNSSMLYDCSYPTSKETNPPVWPYTLDQGYQSSDCPLPPCPSASSKYPGIWSVPMIDVVDQSGNPCSMLDNCGNRSLTRLDTFNMLKSNFQRHYNTSKAPFGLFLTANAWFSYGYTLDGYTDFLTYLGSLDNVYIVSIGKGLDWIKNPMALNQIGSTTGVFGCPSVTQLACNRVSCNYDDFTISSAYASLSSRNPSPTMMSCIACPSLYPWVDNPTGNATLAG